MPFIKQKQITCHSGTALILYVEIKVLSHIILAACCTEATPFKSINTAPSLSCFVSTICQIMQCDVTFLLQLTNAYLR